MIFLLNYAYLILLAVAVFVAWRFKFKTKPTLWIAGIYIATLLALNAVTPSYMPKGTVRDNQVSQFEAVDAPVENRLRQARTEEEHDERLSKGLDWKQKAEQSKAEAEKSE